MWAVSARLSDNRDNRLLWIPRAKGGQYRGTAPWGGDLPGCRGGRHGYLPILPT